MALQSFTLDGQRFSVVRPVDSATPALEEAVAKGTAFSTASVFFFDLSNSSSPTAKLIFQDVLASSIMIDTTNLPEETDGFAFESLAAEQGPAQSVPEPSSALLLSAGAVSLTCLVRRRSLQQMHDYGHETHRPVGGHANSLTAKLSAAEEAEKRGDAHAQNGALKANRNALAGLRRFGNPMKSRGKLNSLSLLGQFRHFERLYPAIDRVYSIFYLKSRARRCASSRSPRAERR